jgi:hypothetical protein
MRTLIMTLAFPAFLAVPMDEALAQPVPPANQAASAPRGPGATPGLRQGMGPRGGMAGPNYTPGWQMMTPAERDEHRSRMLNAKTAEECRQIMAEQRQRMQERAAAAGRGPMPQPRRGGCYGWGP